MRRNTKPLCSPEGFRVDNSSNVRAKRDAEAEPSDTRGIVEESREVSGKQKYLDSALS